MDSGRPEGKESNHVGHPGSDHSNSAGFHNDGLNLSHTQSNKNESIDGESLSSGKSDLSSLLERVRGVSYHYSYLDHPADVILLGEGKSIREALQSISVALFNYISDLSFVDPAHCKELEISGRGLLNLLYHLLDECLYLYSSEYFIAKHVLIEEDLSLPSGLSAEQFNNHTFAFRAVAVGDYYNKIIHRSGTEVKAITMHYLNFNFWLGGRCYEYKNDMESQDNTLQLLSGLAANNYSISRCSVYCLRKRTIESDVRKFYSSSFFIPGPFAYLKDFHTKPESWDVCLSILFKHSACPEKITRPTVPVLLYSAITLKLHAYGGFSHQFSDCLANKYTLIWDICDRVLTLVVAYSRSHPQICEQLSCVVACTVIYGFEPSHSASRLLFLIALAKTEDGTLAQYLYLASVAREVMGQNIFIQLNHRCSFIRACIGLAPRIFSKLISCSRRGEIALDHYRMSALSEWINLHMFLIRVFYPVNLENKFLESFELVFEDLMMPRRKLSDLELVHRSLNTLRDSNAVDLVVNFLKYGIASEDEKIVSSSCELSAQLLSLCQVDLTSLLMMANQKYYELLDVKDRDERWNLACKHALTSFSNTVRKLTVDFLAGLCRIGSSLFVCGQPERKLRFLRPFTSKWLLDLFISASREHLPFVLHFGLVKQHYVHNLCRFISLFLYSDIFSLRKAALDFWDCFQDHLCPPRKDLSYITTCALENVRTTVLKFIRPCYEYFVVDLYKSCIISEGDDFEALSLYRELVVNSLRKALLITGTDCVLKLVREDLDSIVNQFNVQVLERCVFVTSVLASRISGGKDVVKSVILISLDMIDFRKIPQTRTQPVNLYRNSVFRLILWTSAFICNDDYLLDRTIRFISDQIKSTKNTNMPLNAHVYLDQAVLGLCFNLNSGDRTKRSFIDYLTCSISNYVFPLEKRLEIIEAFNAVLDGFPLIEALQLRYNMVKGFFYKICHINSISQMPESYLFILAAMSSLNFTNQKEMRLDFAVHIVDFISKFIETEDFWRYLSEVILYTSVSDQSLGSFSSNSVQNNKTSFLFWTLKRSRPGFFKLVFIKTLLSQNIIQTCSKLYELIASQLIAVGKIYLNLIKSNSHPADHQAIDLLECFSLVLVRWQLVPRLFEWRELGDFICAVANSLPRKLSNLNYAGYSVVAKFVGWADFPKQLITNIEASKYQIFKDIKSRSRDILNRKDKDNSSLSVIYYVIDAIFRAAVSRADHMESWITLASQTLSVLINCSQTLQNTRVSLKSVMNDRCVDMGRAHISFYHKKILQAKGFSEIGIILNIISDYHFSNFTMY
ncbi:hypothetical protein MACK_001027 [Theileria orientalis]|uniref:Archease domain-containing protein n=1 Tax=Theileria orientalis TaxID=68886 RepID=A0A976QV15_THEOR|nr:hypothetical protein MACK_001027 [Theileria orientalis]